MTRLAPPQGNNSFYQALIYILKELYAGQGIIVENNEIFNNNIKLRWKDAAGTIHDILWMGTDNGVRVNNPSGNPLLLNHGIDSDIHVFTNAPNAPSRQFMLNTINADNINTLRDSSKLNFRAKYWNGSVSTNYNMYLQHIIDATTPSSHLAVKNNADSEVMSISDAGILKIDKISELTSGAGITVNNNIKMGSSSIDIGTSTTKVNNIYANQIFQGDLVFENGFRLTEGNKVGYDADTIAMLNDNGEVVSLFDRSGNLYLKGEVRKL